jgi:hypothetical protein
MKPQNSPAASEEAAPVTPVEQPAETTATPETAPAPETDEVETEESETAAGEETAPPVETPAAPDASASAPQRLTAFDRGALRLLGKGDLVARTERAESEVARLAAENTRLATELAQFKAETPKQIAQAAAGRQDEVAKGVAAELAGLGISPEAAPGQIAAEKADKTLTRAEFDKLDHTARNQFFRDGGQLV